MKKRVVIVGATPFSTLMRRYLEQGAFEVLAYAVETAFLKADELDGLPLVAYERLAEHFPSGEVNLLNTVGYVQMNGVRARLHAFGQGMGYGFVTYVHPSAVVNSEIGAGSIVLENASIGFRNGVGIGTVIWQNVAIAHDCQVGDFTYWGPGAIACGNVHVGKRCFIGAGAILRNRITVADECLAGAGVYMNRSVNEPGTVFRAPYPDQLDKKSSEIF